MLHDNVHFPQMNFKKNSNHINPKITILEIFGIQNTTRNDKI